MFRWRRIYTDYKDWSGYPCFPETRYPGLPANLKFYPDLQKPRFCLYRTNYEPFYPAFANNYWVSSLFFPSLLGLGIPYIVFLYFVLSNYHVQCTVIKEKEKRREGKVPRPLSTQILRPGWKFYPAFQKYPGLSLFSVLLEKISYILYSTVNLV